MHVPTLRPGNPVPAARHPWRRDAYSERFSLGATAMQETRLGWVRALRRGLNGKRAKP